MTSYFIHALDRHGALAMAHRVQGTDDLEALAAGVRGSDFRAIEIWQGARLVARVKLGNAPLGAADACGL